MVDLRRDYAAAARAQRAAHLELEMEQIRKERGRYQRALGARYRSMHAPFCLNYTFSIINWSMNKGVPDDFDQDMIAFLAGVNQ